MGCRHLANLLPVTSSERVRSVLDVERSWRTEGGVEETASKERIALSASRSSGLLGQRVDDPDVMAHDPLLVRRLRRLPDDARLRARATVSGSAAARR